MKSSRYYLVKALLDWIVDNECTPHIMVNAEYPGVDVPRHAVKDGQIVLNISASAARHFTMAKASISFEARFNGVAEQVFIPIHAVMGIYARENGQGMVFELDPALVDEPLPEAPAPRPRPALKVIK